MTNCLQCGLLVEDLDNSTSVLDGNQRVHDWCLSAFMNSSADLTQPEATVVMPITTGYTTVAGTIIEEIDIVTSECVFGVNIFKDILGGVRDIVGGRAGAHQKVLKDLRKTCLDELRMNAAEMGADAVIGVDLDYSEISGKNGGLLMLVASGTAVKLEPKE